MAATVGHDNVVPVFGVDFMDHNGIHRISQKGTLLIVGRCQGFVSIVACITILSDVDDVILVHSRTQYRTSTGHA